MPSLNVSLWLDRSAEQFPNRNAVITPGHSSSAPGRKDRPEGHRLTQYVWTFSELKQTADAYAWTMHDCGLRQGDRALVMIRPGFGFVAVSFALLKIGVVPVYIDPGMGLRAMSQCIKEVRPDAFVAIPVAHIFPLLLPAAFRTAHKRIIVDGGALAGLLRGERLAKAAAAHDRPFEPVRVAGTDEAIIAFTSGSTGIPKGVQYTHPMLDALMKTLRDEIGIQQGEVDLPILPVFALFNPALGVTTVMPDMNPSKVATADPTRLVPQIQANRVTTTFGSPTVWRRVADYCLQHGLQLTTIKRILIAGAPVPVELLRDLKKILPGGTVLTPYGATEAIALTSIDLDEILAEADRGAHPDSGVCVGKPFSHGCLHIIPISDEAIDRWDPDLVFPPGRIGEIVARSPVVTHLYVNRPQETARAKIRDGDAVLHRMGDVGYLDEEGRLWFCGRKSHRVVTEHGLLLPVPCEAVFNRHLQVARTALVGLGPAGGKQTPLLVVEPIKDTAMNRKQLTAELLQLGARHEHTRHIKQILFHPRFPVDVRHNAKIQRERLRTWAEGQRRTGRDA